MPNRYRLRPRAASLRAAVAEKPCQAEGAERHRENDDRRRLRNGSAATRTTWAAAAAAAAPASSTTTTTTGGRDAFGSGAIEDRSVRAFDATAAGAATETTESAATAKHAAPDQAGTAQTTKGSQLARSEARPAEARAWRIDGATRRRLGAAARVNRRTRLDDTNGVRPWPDPANNAVDVMVMAPATWSGWNT